MAHFVFQRNIKVTENKALGTVGRVAVSINKHTKRRLQQISLTFKSCSYAYYLHCRADAFGRFITRFFVGKRIAESLTAVTLI
jgi:hypothetical protein